MSSDDDQNDIVAAWRGARTTREFHDGLEARGFAVDRDEKGEIFAVRDGERYPITDRQRPEPDQEPDQLEAAGVTPLVPTLTVGELVERIEQAKKREHRAARTAGTRRAEARATASPFALGARRGAIPAAAKEDSTDEAPRPVPVRPSPQRARPAAALSACPSRRPFNRSPNHRPGRLRRASRYTVDPRLPPETSRARHLDA